VLWDGHYTNLKLVATIFEDSEGKHQVSIPMGSFWATSISIENAPQTAPVMGSEISIGKLVAGFWNPEAVQAEYNSKSQVSAQSGTLRFVSSQSIKLEEAKVSMPSCQLDARLDFSSIPLGKTSFDFKLGDSGLILHDGRFASPGITRTIPARLDCKDFHAVLSSFRTGRLVADISPSEIKFKTSITDAGGAFLARIGAQPEVPVIGQGRLSTVAIEAPSLRKPDEATIGQVAIGGLQFSSSIIPTIANFRRLANDIGNSLALPDFLSPEQQQLKAIQDSADALTKLSNSAADVLVHIPATEVKFLTDQKLKELGIRKIIDFGFGKQEILAFIPASGTNSPVSLALHLAISIGDTYVSVRPSISFATLSSFSSAQVSSGKRTPEQLAEFLAVKLGPIAKPLTTLDTQIKIPIPTNNVYPPCQHL
jgi:hypothetical protein